MPLQTKHPTSKADFSSGHMRLEFSLSPKTPKPNRVSMTSGESPTGPVKDRLSASESEAFNHSNPNP